MPPQFQSVGGAAGNAIQQFLVQREMQNRQRMLAELEQKAQADAVAQQEADRALREQDLALRKEQEARVAAAQAEINKSLIDQRKYTQVKGMVDDARPDDADLDPETVKMVEEQGFGSKLKRIPGIVSQGPLQEEPSEANGYVPTYAVDKTPDRTKLQPGAKYTDAEAQRTFLERQAEETRAFRERQEAKELALKEFMAKAQIDMQQGTLNTQNMLAGLNAIILKGKIDDADKKRDDDEAARTNNVENTLEMLDRLEQHPGLDAATGAYEMRGFTQDAKSWRRMADSVVAALTMPNLSTLKGQMSDKDVAFMKEKSTILQNPDISGEDARQAIRDAREFLRTGRIPKASAAGGATDPNARAAEFLKNRGRGNGR